MMNRGRNEFQGPALEPETQPCISIGVPAEQSSKNSPSLTKPLSINSPYPQGERRPLFFRGTFETRLCSLA
jgi:hypothetical protein